MNSVSKLEKEIKKLIPQEIPAAALTARKAAAVVDTQGYKISGLVVLNPETNGRGIIELSAVRWLDTDEMWWLMHTSADSHVPKLNKLTPSFHQTDDVSFTTALDTCARCGKAHAYVRFSKMDNPIGEYDFWAPCPNNGQPIILKRS